MSTIEKLIQKLLAKPPDVRFSDVEKVLEHYGYRDRKSGTGSHHVFIRPDSFPIIVPTVKGRRVKKVYVQMLIDRLGLEDQYESEE